jgi:hypothetical protein
MMTEIYKNIFIINDFISVEEQEYILSLINESNEEDWNQTYINHIKNKQYDTEEDLINALESRNTFWDDKIFHIKNEDFWKDLTDRVSLFFNNQYEINPMYAIQRQMPGTFLKVHFDQGTNPELQKAVIIYINDNYNGGELFFPEHDFEIKPPSRSMIIFPGTEDYMHGVKEVLAGPTRYVLPSFGFVKK